MDSDRKPIALGYHRTLRVEVASDRQKCSAEMERKIYGVDFKRYSLYSARLNYGTNSIFHKQCTFDKNPESGRFFVQNADF